MCQSATLISAQQELDAIRQRYAALPDLTGAKVKRTRAGGSVIPDADGKARRYATRSATLEVEGDDGQALTVDVSAFGEVGKDRADEVVVDALLNAQRDVAYLLARLEEAGAGR